MLVGRGFSKPRLNRREHPQPPKIRATRPQNRTLAAVRAARAAMVEAAVALRAYGVATGHCPALPAAIKTGPPGSAGPRG